MALRHEESPWQGKQYFCKSKGRWFAITNDGRKVFRSRAVMEMHLGRPVAKTEIVHHINGVPTDDRIENLQLVKGDQGYHTSIVHYGYTEKRLLDMLVEHAKRINSTPTHNTIENDPKMPSSKTYSNRFGGLTEALVEVNLLPEELHWRGHEYSKEELIFKLQELHRRVSRRPIITDLERYADMPHQSTYKKYFGTWMNALSEAGLASLPNPRRKPKPKYSKQILINQLLTLQERLGRVPLRVDLKSYDDMAGKTTFSKYFGSWKNALKEAGII